MKINMYQTPFDHLTYCLVLNPREYSWIQKKYNLEEKDFLSLGGSAQTDLFGCKFAIVSINPDLAIEDYQYNSMLVHEAIHIWQEMCGIIGEKYPSQEFEAYCVQQISQNLMYEFSQRRKQ